MCPNNQTKDEAKENGADTTQPQKCCGKCGHGKERWDFNAVSALISSDKPANIQNPQGIQPNG
jgi:hypothetical protein